MRIYRLNCGTMRVPGGTIPTWVLLIDTGSRLILVDSGVGTADIADPAGRLGPLRFATRPFLDLEETAVRQIAVLGKDPSAVSDIVLTHMDSDHIGGLSDFPDARVHVAEPTIDHAVRSPTGNERRRYRRAQWAHGPRFEVHPHVGATWEGFDAVELSGLPVDLTLISLPGHAAGHYGVLVPGGGRPEGRADSEDTGTTIDLLHVGDAVHHLGSLGHGPPPPRWVRLLEPVMAMHSRAHALTREELSRLAARRGDDLEMICSHGPDERPS